MLKLIGNHRRYFLTQLAIIIAYLAAMTTTLSMGNTPTSYWATTLGYVLAFCALAATGIFYKKGSKHRIFFSVALPLIIMVAMIVVSVLTETKVAVWNQDYTQIAEHVKIGAIYLLMFVMFVIPIAAATTILSMVTTRLRKRATAGEQ
ncbi:hypothetical protein FACS1894202_09290 [Clostridia bacterium]|nr:hypothetical protein FACS1894202_09290 [Clostridia bacterium]